MSTMSTAKIIIMTVFCLITAGVLFFTITWFFRRIRMIEEENWGPRKKKEEESPPTETKE